MTGVETREPGAGMHGRPPARSRARSWFAAAATLAAFVLLCALGTWQVERLQWKQEIIETIEARIAAAPQSVAEVEARLGETGDVDYWPVRLQGRFLHEAERHFLSTFEGQAGWNIHTPLLLDDGRVVFVNRGFVPYEMKQPETRPEGQAEGTVEITGLARNAPTGKPGSFVPDNDLAQNIFFWRSMEDMAAGLGPDVRIVPFFVDIGSGRAPGGYPVGGTTVIDIPNNHLQYAITWYGLAAVLAIMCGTFLLRGRRRRKA